MSDKAQASASAAAAAAQAAKGMSGLTITAIVFTVIAVVLAGVYFSGVADGLFEYLAVMLFKAKAKAEVTALEHTGSEQAAGFLKGVCNYWICHVGT